MASERCPTCHRRHRRTNPQNARYWLLLHAIAGKLKPTGNEFAPDVWHEYMKSRFLGCEEVTLPNGKTLQIPHSTADLDVAAFNEFMEKVEAWAGEREVWLEDITA